MHTARIATAEGGTYLADQLILAQVPHHLRHLLVALQEQPNLHQTTARPASDALSTRAVDFLLSGQ